MEDPIDLFESSVNSEGIETESPHSKSVKQFESSVNSEGIETVRTLVMPLYSLRAV